ncbi:3-hydroxyacyl-CoA dehydrogenase [Deltaproteobacteria bacterium TL4]
MEIKDKVVVVTGGASGLGEACVRLLLGAGAKVSILDFNEDAGTKLAEALGSQVMFQKTDVSNDQSVQNSIQATIAQFKALHIVINCAGIAPPMKVYSQRKGIMPFDYFNKIIQVNLIGTMNVIRHATAQIVNNEPNADGEKGVIINTASVAAFDGQIGQAAYSASKGGVVGMTLPIAREFASYGIRVMTIAPGLFHTPMMASLSQEVQDSLASSVPFPKRLGKPDEYAQLAQHIIQNPMLNGETIRLDGSIRLEM